LEASPVTSESSIKVHVHRFDPKLDTSPHKVTYTVPFWPEMRVLEALRVIHETYEPLAFRSCCRAKLCGSCAVTIDGEPGLACEVKASNDMLIEPLAGFPVLKDLVVDFGGAQSKLDSLQMQPVRQIFVRLKPETISFDAIEEMKKFSYCVWCQVCNSACPSFRNAPKDFAGPSFFTQLARMSADPRDNLSRQKQAYQLGLFNCVGCFRCEEVCPYDISVLQEGIEPLKERSFEMRLNPRHTDVFLRLVRDSGLIDSSRLFLKTKGYPSISDIPWTIRLLSKRKASVFPKKALRCSDEIERIFEDQKVKMN
jgi:succinate dehydrogenase/fumarate reductase iron-sulfur protein